MEENVKLMSVLKIGLEASKQGHGRGGMLGWVIHHIFSGQSSGWECWRRMVHVGQGYCCRCSAISQSIPHETSTQGSWVTHPEALTYVAATETGLS